MPSNKTGLGKLTISYKVKPNISPMTQVFIYHDLYKSVYSSHIYDSQILKTTLLSSNSRIDRQVVVYLYNE